ncbi:TIM23 complex component [Coemansia spiralis]|uniref:Presequence translocated-associated motor subunit PAM17 n=2 Tax=Coemansia TaxID=4863 RepID=A0A9W8KZR9_9FUNG|nr:mitochondrial import protein Pam17-domain-containing protein [Coemansia spiralis]KAJ1995495.1 TIM23 complex component [Coemansia umbellata]KAJ2625172.1 TIM23 complex component [Coemansia sp. RSA 1358]KAJ2679874.1 TIM23 complex component [Coemansia spiralis]
MLGTIGTFRTSAMAQLVSRTRATQSRLARTFVVHNPLGSLPISRALHSTQLLLAKPQAVKAAQMATEEQLSWSDFFTLRKQRRLWDRLASFPCAILGLGVGSAVFASLPVNPQQMFMGLDPMVVFAGATLFCGVLGFISGPTFGRMYFRIGNPRLAKTLDLKEAEFFKHIRANRSDPAFSSASNPLPDFYGEKINSLRAYRKWLRRQREHERKGTFNLGSKRK